MTGQLIVRNRAQKILWEQELAGQISDGAWENSSPHEHWVPWCDADVLVAEPGILPGRTFYAPRDSYLFTSKELLSIIGDRMLEYVRAEIPEYDWPAMLADLRDLRKIIKRVVPRYFDQVATLPQEASGSLVIDSLTDIQASVIEKLAPSACSCQADPAAWHRVLPAGCRAASDPADAMQNWLEPVENARTPVIVPGTWFPGGRHTFRHAATGKNWGTYDVQVTPAGRKARVLKLA